MQSVHSASAEEPFATSSSLVLPSVSSTAGVLSKSPFQEPACRFFQILKKRHQLLIQLMSPFPVHSPRRAGPLAPHPYACAAVRAGPCACGRVRAHACRHFPLVLPLCPAQAPREGGPRAQLRRVHAQNAGAHALHTDSGAPQQGRGLTSCSSLRHLNSFCSPML